MPTLDGTATGIAGGSSPVSATLTTTTANDIICALVFIEAPTANRWISGVSGGGLTWAKRTQATGFAASGFNAAQSLELWWALAPSPLAAVTITATMSGAYDDAAILVFGVAGCNTTAPWDANASLAARLSFFGATVPTFNGISTTQANDFLIFGFGSGASQGIGTVPTGFTQIGATINGGGARWASIGAAYRNVTSAQSNQTYAWGSVFASGGNAAIFDALTADTGGSTASPRPNWEVLTRNTVSAGASVALETAGISANDVFVLLAYCQNAGAAPPAISSVSGGGLTWVRRLRSHGSTLGNLEVWSAQATGTLALSTITVTYASSADGASVVLLSVAGCDTSRWDGNVGLLPAMVSNTANANPWTPSLSASTSQAHDLVIAAVGLANNNTFAQLNSVPTGFTPLAQMVTGASWFSALAVGTQVRTTTQSGAAVTWGAAVADTRLGIGGGEYIVDALTADVATILATARQYAVTVVT